ncbi:hypothetical protein Q0M94_11940 [Deinococcus radiomollis]|uniref:hypothetical protein n=1 Tax=Deinococcus radiomollis TaxID=468916 RepID=UPI0038924EF3
MSDLELLRSMSQELFHQEADLLYPHSSVWSDGTDCRYGIQDPNRTDAGVRLAQRLTGTPDVLDVRLLRVHPDAPKPGTRATIPWDGGTLTLEDWSQVSEITIQATGVCRFVR